jgi:hypothetical protein
MSKNSAKLTAWVSILLLITSIGSQLAAAWNQEKGSGTQNPSSASDAQATTPATKVKVHPGSIDDIDAIGKRNVGKGLDWFSEKRETEFGRQLARELEQNRYCCRTRKLRSISIASGRIWWRTLMPKLQSR